MIFKLAEIIKGLELNSNDVELQKDELPGGNLLVCADCLQLLQQLEVENKMSFIYIDPPYASGADYLLSDGRVAFTDRWKGGVISYLQMLAPRLVKMRDCLTCDGSIFVHVDHHASAHVRLLLDYIFGQNCFRNEIVWCYRQGGRSTRSFARKHDNIFWYSKSPKNWIFNSEAIRIPYHGTGGYQQSGNGVIINGINYRPHPNGKIPEDWWDIPAIPPMSVERCGYPTQKPLTLIERIISACSNKGDIVADFFVAVVQQHWQHRVCIVNGLFATKIPMQ